METFAKKYREAIEPLEAEVLEYIKQVAEDYSVVHIVSELDYEDRSDFLDEVNTSCPSVMNLRDGDEYDIYKMEKVGGDVILYGIARDEWISEAEIALDYAKPSDLIYLADSLQAAISKE